MEEILAKLVNAVLSEYGAFVLFLLLGIVLLWRSKEAAEKRNMELTDRLLDVVDGNTKAMTGLTSKIDHQKEVSDARSS